MVCFEIFLFFSTGFWDSKFFPSLMCGSQRCISDGQTVGKLLLGNVSRTTKLRLNPNKQNLNESKQKQNQNETTPKLNQN